MSIPVSSKKSSLIKPWRIDYINWQEFFVILIRNSAQSFVDKFVKKNYYRVDLDIWTRNYQEKRGKINVLLFQLIA